MAYKTLSSEVYNIDKKIGKSFGDIEFYQQLLNGVKGMVLEPGTGNGRVLFSLYDAGFNIEGFDLSSTMLNYAKNYAKEHRKNVNLFHANMVDFNRACQYEAIIIPTGTFCLIIDEDAVKKALKNFYEHLKPKGYLILDLLVPTSLTLDAVPTRSFQTDAGEVIEVSVKNISKNETTKVFHSVNHYVKKYKGQTIAEEEEKFDLKWHDIMTFKQWLRTIGFDKITIYSDYDLHKPIDRSKLIYTIKAQKSH